MDKLYRQGLAELKAHLNGDVTVPLAKLCDQAVRLSLLSDMSWGEIVKKACATELEFRNHSSDGRMSPEAIIQSCYAYGGTGPEKVSELREALQANTPQLRGARAFVSQVYKWIIEGRCVSGVPRDIVRMSVPSRDEARQELAEINHNLWSLWAIAVENARDRHPEVFGIVADPLAWQHKLDNLKVQRAELFQRISESFEADDLVVSDIKPDGRALVTLALASGQVTLGPLHTLGERLVNHLLSTEPEKWSTKAQPAPVHTDRKRVSEASLQG